MEDLRAHRPDSLDALLATYGRQIQGVAYLVLHSQADAEEVVIDTLMTAWSKASNLRDPHALKPWLLRIATRHALDRQRSSCHVDPLPPDMLHALDPSARLTERMALTDAISGLPPRMRAAIGLHYYADLSVDEVAAAIGRSRNTVKTELRLALEKLRTELTPESDEPPGVASDAS